MRAKGKMKNLKMTVQYDGTDYAGFQVQKGRETIQGKIQEVLQAIFGQKISIVCAGRTDAGVHAIGQVINFKTKSNIPFRRLRWSINNMLPKDIAITEIEEMNQSFDARRDAKYREYRYYILNSPIKSPFQYRYSLLKNRNLNIEAMNKAASLLIGKHDFSAFTVSEDTNTSKVREVKELELFKERSNILVIKILADAYLKSMARTIVGTLLEFGYGNKDWPEMKVILESKNRHQVGQIAPAQGLFLYKVYY